MMREELNQAKRIVVKIGTSTITNDKGRLDSGFLKSIAKQIAIIKKSGKEVIIVTSGAIGAGAGELGIKQKPREITLKQVCAAVGQNILMAEYEEAFRKFKIKTAQLLLTYDSFSKRSMYLHLRRAINTLLKIGVVPVINENDPISVDEIGATFGDNDKLSALVASKLDADLLVMLSDVEGLCERKPKKGEKLEVIPEVDKVTSSIERMCGTAGSSVGRGGMKTKISAARIVASSGCSMVIADGSLKDVLVRILRGDKVGTLFRPAKKLPNKARWIMLAQPKGQIQVNTCAKDALKGKKSLLAVGITGVKGNFKAGDVVTIVCGNRVILKARVDYSLDELKKVIGRKTDEIKKVLEHHGPVVKRENMVKVR